MDEKLLKKLQTGKSQVRIDEIVKIMESYGFIGKKTKHGYLFLHEKLKGITLPHVPIPHGREKRVLKPYIEACLLVIDVLLKGEKK